MGFYYFLILRGPCFIKLFHTSQVERDTKFPLIFVKELENKCSNWEMKCQVNGRQNIWHLGEQKFGGNLPQLTRNLRSRKKYLQDILEKQLNLQKFYFFGLRVPFNCKTRFACMQFNGLWPFPPKFNIQYVKTLI